MNINYDYNADNKSKLAVSRLESNQKLDETKVDGCIFKPSNILKLDDLINN